MILWRAATGRSRLNDPEARWNKLSLRTKPAEAAVLDGIADLALSQLSRGSLILESAKAAVQRRADLEDQSEPLRHGPLETSRRDVIVGGTAIVAAFGLPMRALAYQISPAS